MTEFKGSVKTLQHFTTGLAAFGALMACLRNKNLNFQSKNNFFLPVFRGTKLRRRTKRSTVHDFKCLVGFFSATVIVSDCLAAVKYETKTEAEQKNTTSDMTFIVISISWANSSFK